jgi:hypothetical protein
MMSPISNSMGGHPHGPMSNGPTNGLHAGKIFKNDNTQNWGKFLVDSNFCL